MRLGSIVLLAFLAACDGLYVSDEEALGYYDRDGDGYPVSAAAAFGATGPYDCDDGSDAVHPGATELCNGADDDCDGPIDEEATDAPAWYADLDQDQHGAGSALVQCDAPPNHVASDDDCDDGDDTVLPGATEICNGVDDDCDEQIDEDGAFVAWYPDEDGDGFGDPEGEVLACSAPDTGWVTVGEDCDDDASAVNPDAEEVWYDGTDQDCSGGSDHDQDGDGYDAVGSGGLDCEDTVAEANPDGTEICNGIDDDCNGQTDEAGDLVPWYPDADGDGHGDADGLVMSCTKPGTDWVLAGDDCDDADGTAWPGATETCDGVDDDCDSTIDEDVKTTFYADTDKDSYGDAASTIEACAAPSGYVADDTDCDDGQASVHPDATEVPYDSTDQDCDGADLVDVDGDGYDGTAAGGDDCDDDRADVHPGATDAWYDGVDQDCGGNSDYDQDADGYDADAYSGTDCDDTKAAIHPGATEVWYDGTDQDCDSASDYDQDGDGFDSDAYSGTDCDDTKASVKPGAAEVWYDGTDQDCDGESDYDQDGDGFDSDAYSGTDCDDTKASVEPGAAEIWYDGVDQNCDGGSDYDQDGDGYDSDAYSGDDCDDTTTLASPALSEVCEDGLDNDCDGTSNACALTGTVSISAADTALPITGWTDISAGDTDGDGDDDIAVLTTDVFVYEAPLIGSSSTLLAKVFVPPGFTAASLRGDHDGDGYADLAASHAGSLYIYPGPIDSAWAVGATASTAGDMGATLGVVGDLDGDGTDEAAIGGTGGGIMIFDGPMSGTLSAYSNQAGCCSYGSAIAPGADLDADGNGDVIVTLPGTGGGGQSIEVLYGPFLASGATALTRHSVGTPISVSDTIGDLSGDGRPDVVVGVDSSSRAYVFFGRFPVAATPDVYIDVARPSVAVGDFDGDGIHDVAIASGSDTAFHGAVYLLYGPLPAGSTLTAASAAAFTIEGTSGEQISSRVRAADVNGDGFDDVVIGTTLGVAVFYGSGL